MYSSILDSTFSYEAFSYNKTPNGDSALEAKGVKNLLNFILKETPAERNLKEILKESSLTGEGWGFIRWTTTKEEVEYYR